jgi:hypothetical protein
MLFVFAYVDLFSLYRPDFRADLEAGKSAGSPSTSRSFWGRPPIWFLHNTGLAVAELSLGAVGAEDANFDWLTLVAATDVRLPAACLLRRAPFAFEAAQRDRRALSRGLGQSRTFPGRRRSPRLPPLDPNSNSPASACQPRRMPGPHRSWRRGLLFRGPSGQPRCGWRHRASDRCCSGGISPSAR